MNRAQSYRPGTALMAQSQPDQLTPVPSTAASATVTVNGGRKRSSYQNSHPVPSSLVGLLGAKWPADESGLLLLLFDETDGADVPRPGL